MYTPVLMWILHLEVAEIKLRVRYSDLNCAQKRVYRFNFDK